MRIFLVRHGRYDEDTGLMTLDGRYDVEIACGALVTAGIYNNRGYFKVICSPRKRAVQAAEVLALPLTYEIVDWLDDGPGYPARAFQKLLGFTELRSVPENVVAISHMPVIAGVVEAFAELFGQQFLGDNPGYGSVHLVDATAKTVTKLT